MHFLQKFFSILALFIFIVVLGFFIVPIFNVFFVAGKNIFLGKITKLSLIYIGKIAIYTFCQAFFSTLLALIFGTISAFFVSQKNFFARSLLLSFSVVPLCMPPLLVALGYIAVFGMSGIINKMFMGIFSLSESPLTFLYSIWGIILCQGFYNFPLVMAHLVKKWETIPPCYEESAKLLGANNLRIFKTITFWQLLPAYISSAIQVFLYCFFSFTIVLLFGQAGKTSFEAAIFHSLRATSNPENAYILAISETFFAILILFVYTTLEKNASSNWGSNFIEKNRERISKKELPLFILFVLITFIFFMLPFLSVAIKGISISSLKSLFRLSTFKISLKNTIISASCTATLSVICGFFAAISAKMFFKDGKNIFFKTAPLFPQAISSMVIGTGILLSVKKGSVAHLILAQTALFWPFSYRQIYSALYAIPQNVLDSAKLLSKTKTDIVFRIILPYGFSSAIQAWGFSFAMSAGDTALPLVLSIPQFEPLSILVYRLSVSYRLPQACAAGMILGLLCMGVFALSSNANKINGSKTICF